MSFIVVDASLWVSLLVPQDEFHDAVKTWVERQRLSGITFISPSLLLSKVAGAISHRTGNSELAIHAINLLENLPDLRLVDMEQKLAHEAARLAADLGLRGADAFYVAIAAWLIIPLITLDQDQAKRGAVRVEVESIKTA